MWSDVLFIHLGSRYLKGNFFGLLPLQVASYRRRLTSFLTFFNITRAACSPTWAFHSCSCQGKQDLYLSLNINQSSKSVLQHCCHVFTWPSVNSHLGHLMRMCICVSRSAGSAQLSHAGCPPASFQSRTTTEFSLPHNSPHCQTWGSNI